MSSLSERIERRLRDSGLLRFPLTAEVLSVDTRGVPRVGDGTFQSVQDFVEVVEALHRRGVRILTITITPGGVCLYRFSTSMRLHLPDQC